MDDQRIQELLTQADKRFQAARSHAARAPEHHTEFAGSLRARRNRENRRRRLGAVAVLVLLAGVLGWSWNLGLWRDQPIDAVASNDVTHADRDATSVAANEPAQIRLRDEEIARLKTEIAALDAEANQAQRFVELYKSAEARRQRLAAAESASADPLLPLDVLADLEIDRAAAITVISADAQANSLNRDDAAESYRSVVKHFPASRWASVARERLLEIEHMN